MEIFAKEPLSLFQRAAKPFSLLESRGNSSERWQCREKRPRQHNLKVGVLFTPHEVFFYWFGTVSPQVPVSSGELPFNNHSSALSQGVAYSEMGGSQHRMQAPFQSDPSFQPTVWPSSEPWPLQASSQPKKDFGGRNLNLALHQRASISVKERGLLRLYYEKIFQNLQQTNCRIIAKAYIKLIEPRKQVNYPYNGRKIVEGRTQQLNPEATCQAKTMRSAHPPSNPPGRATTNPGRGIPSPRGGGKLHRWDFRYILARILLKFPMLTCVI